MASQNEHGKLIAAAAKAALSPLGLLRKGQSRIWRSDQRFWVITVEFQPSSWSKGSYLNVGAGWLWHPSASISFDAGYRIGDVGDAGFLPFENAEQFQPRVIHMADRAAREVVAIRERFKTFSDIHSYVVSRATRDGSPVHYAAVTSALVGEIEAARSLFRRLAEWQTCGFESWQAVKDRSADLAAMLDDPPRFRAEVLARIQRTRQLNGFRADPHCLDDALDSRGVR